MPKHRRAFRRPNSDHALNALPPDTNPTCRPSARIHIGGIRTEFRIRRRVADFRRSFCSAWAKVPQLEVFRAEAAVDREICLPQARVYAERLG